MSKNRSKRRPGRGAGAGPKPSGDGAYQHRIPDRNTIIEQLREKGRPMDYDELAAANGVSARQDKRALSAVLSKMLRSGQLHLNRGEEYCLSERLDLVTGTVSAHPDGYGFVVPDAGGDDAFLSPREMQSVMHGDRVAIKITKTDSRGRLEGKLIEVLERGSREIAGRYISERGIGVVIPDNPKINHRVLIPPRERGGAKPGEMVVVEILDYPTAVEQATGRITEVLGSPEKSGMATDLAIHAHGIPNEWPKAVRAAADEFGPRVPISAKRDRKDLRDLPLVTIDGADARDFDDAVFATKKGDGWRLIVAIADVAHYVQPGSDIDGEAVRRGTSVYFPDRVVPMLPEVLSNGLCSLNPKVDRLCLVCDMTLSPQGEVTRSTFYDGVMKSAARLKYGEVGEYLEGGKPGKAIRGEIRDSIDELHAIFKQFSRRRARRGAIELDLPQLRIRMTDDGEVEGIASVPRNDAHRLIEECMIAANVEAAKFIGRRKVPALYRVHAKPDEERFDEFRLYMTDLGFKVPHSQHPKPQDLRRLMLEVQDRPDAFAINMALLRSFQHAEYSPDNIGHFGLALDAYAHFTSPIRRYPDLLVHRAIKHMVNGGKARQHHYGREEMERLGKITSEFERRAEDATREVEGLLKCQFMQQHVGQRYAGLVTGVKHFGLFVQIGELQVDGLVHVSSLRNDYYEHEPAAQRLVGSRTGIAYQLGDAVEIIVDRVDLETRRIDFVLHDHPPAGEKSGGSAQTPAGGKSRGLKSGSRRGGKRRSRQR